MGRGKSENTREKKHLVSQFYTHDPSIQYVHIYIAISLDDNLITGKCSVCIKIYTFLQHDKRGKPILDTKVYSFVMSLK